MSTPDNILGRIGQSVGEEIKALRVSLGNSISGINLNNITGGLTVTKDQATGLGVKTDGKGTFNTLEVSLGASFLGTIAGLRAEILEDLEVNGKITAGSLEVKGETKIINTTSVEVSDNILELNKSSDNSTTATISGIEINRGSSTAQLAQIAFNDSTFYPTFEWDGVTVADYAELSGESASNYDPKPVYESMGDGHESTDNYRIIWYSNPSQQDFGATLDTTNATWIIVASDYSGEINSVDIDSDFSGGNSELTSGSGAHQSGSFTVTDSTIESAEDKARLLWDNSGDMQKFKLMLGDNLADLSSNKLTVPDGNGVVIGVAPIGTYADFTNALATAIA